MTVGRTVSARKIAVYDEPSGGLGGAEYLAAVLVGELGERHDVEFLHHQPLSREQLENFTGVDLSRVALRHIARVRPPEATSSLPWRLWRQNTHWQAGLSRPYDTFINITHGVPPFCRAPHGVLIVLFPFFQRNWMRLDPPQGLDPRRRVRDAYYEFEWRQRMRSYSKIVSISEFTRRWTREYWDLESTVVYPPVDTSIVSEPKQDIVLSVGRFSTTGHPKKQGEIIRAFGRLAELHKAGWRHHSVGALADNAPDLSHFAQLESMAGTSTSLIVNASRAEIKAQFARAKLFVHAAGFGEDVAKPEAMEHFGIATVEAMAAGAVPIVVNRGAQPEIVEHGVNGFVWDTIDELQHYIIKLANDEAARQRMAMAAQRRAEMFSKQKFLARMQALLPDVR